MFNTLFRFYILLMFFLITLSICSLSKASEVLNPTTIKLDSGTLTNIKVEKVQLKDFNNTLTVTGTIKPIETNIVAVTTRTLGRLTTIYVNLGQAVKVGDPLCSLFSPDYELAQEEYLIALKNKDKLLIKLSKEKLLNLGMLLKEFKLLNINKVVQDLTIRSPRTGFVLTTSTLLGNLHQVGDQLFTVGELNKVWFEGNLHESEVNQVRMGQSISIEEGLKGSISFISPIVDPNTHTVKLRAVIDNPEEILRPNSYKSACILLSSSKVMMVPINSVYNIGFKSYVFKRTLVYNTFEKVEVKTNNGTKTEVVINAGLTVGDEIVTEGALLLNEELVRKQ